MTVAVALAVLFSALMHASWNALVRVRVDRLAMITLVAAFSALIAFPGLFVVSAPRIEAWPWLFASIVLHIGYNIFLASAYTHGELGKVYPLARGTAPLLTLLGSFLIVGEPLAVTAVIGIVTLGAGILALTLDQGFKAIRQAGRGVVMALVTSLFVAAYTIADGMGVRAAEDPHAYALWLFFFDGIPLLIYALWVRGAQATGRMVAEHWHVGLLAGALAIAAYWIVLWAMTVAPIALVAAVRETSVVMAVIIGVVFLGERFTAARALSVMIVLAGLLLLRI